MDPKTELEAKLEAHSLTLLEFQEWAAHRHIGVTKITHAVGVDTFYSDLKSVVRFRRSNGVGTCPPVLTFKRRQAPGDIRERFETDLFVDLNRTTEEETKSFLAGIGMHEHFSLLKESYIYHYQHVQHDGVYEVVVALYDVLGPQRGRFLEIEIDKHGTIQQVEAQRILGDWIAHAQRDLHLAEPINKSLYELYAPRTQLFIPESF